MTVSRRNFLLGTAATVAAAAVVAVPLPAPAADMPHYRMSCWAKKPGGEWQWFSKTFTAEEAAGGMSFSAVEIAQKMGQGLSRVDLWGVQIELAA